ncbi:MAG: helical backbone metal receptor [Candidatus Omnitrophica bacterium]|nr:helical backbone metal receptor [Candidatus Omnitrophota bacterium]
MKSWSVTGLLVLIIGTAGWSERIVSLGTYPTQNLVLLGLEKFLVGVTIHEPREIKRDREIIGTLWEPNLEKIVSLKPDVVLASKEGNRPQSVSRLKELRIEVLLLNEVRCFQDACENLFLVGQRFNRSSEAIKLITRLKQELRGIRQTAPGRKPTVFFALGLKPLVTAGRDTFIHHLIEDAGGKNIFADHPGKYLRVSLEEVVRRDPEVIVSLKMEEEADREFWQDFPRLKAVTQQSIFQVSNELFANPTPAQYVEAAWYLRKILGPIGQGKR